MALIGLTGVLAACDLFGGEEVSRTKLVQDETVFIVSTLEASPDTTIHHPQVFVGRLSDPLDPEYRVVYDPTVPKGIEFYMPTFLAQVMWKSEHLRLRYEPDAEAEVTITGPLGERARTVAFQHERNGVYGDLAGGLPVVPGAAYRLDVRLADGRAYTAQTRTPEVPTFAPPDTFYMPLELVQNEPGVWTERNVNEEVHHFECTPSPSDAPLTVYQSAGTEVYDRRVWGLQPGEELWYADRNDYVRQGQGYRIVTHDAYNDYDNCAVLWTNHSRNPFQEWLPIYLRLEQVGSDLAQWYEESQVWVSTKFKEGDVLWEDPWVDNVMDRRLDAVAFRDTTYLPSISNIDRVGPDGEPLPRSASDAVGIFGGYTARYARSVLRPIRSWDPDTLDWGPPLP